jgi:CRP-like cAMP-binding protein
MKMEILKNAISQMIKLTESEAGAFMSMCYRRKFKKKEILSEDEKIIDEVYFIERGILRVKIFDLGGTEHTVHFAIENQFIADYRAFLTKEKSSYLLEAMEETEVIVLPRKAIEWGYINLKEGEKLGRLIAEYYFTYLDRRIEHLYTLSPLQRYELMNQIFPNIHNRVPQHMIASYLGITPIHLSRIKKSRLL